jgi:AraC-like DNA-binding protein
VSRLLKENLKNATLILQWFQNKRLETCTLPNSSRTKKMHQIYLDIGYENLSSFIQAYKIKYGITPGQDSKK